MFYLMQEQSNGALLDVDKGAVGVVRIAELTKALELVRFYSVRRGRRELSPMCADAERPESILDRGDGVLRLR